MREPAKSKVVLQERRRPGRPKKILDLRKLDSVTVAQPESPERAIENLLIFDVRCLDVTTRQELLRILPGLVHISRAWRAEFSEHGCLGCQKKPDPTVAIAARLRRRGSTWAEIYELTAVSASNRAARRRFEGAVHWKLEHLGAPAREPSRGYGAGGFCDRCSQRIYQRMLKHRKLMAGRDVPAEVEAFKDALRLRYNAAQRLLNEEDLPLEELSPENIDFLDEQRRSLRPYDVSRDSLVDLCVRIVRQLNARGKLSLEPEDLRTMLTNDCRRQT